ncbi:glycoside hydrolase family 2 protein [Pedobacter heparinus]|uniref:Glycoside hydrolase family 2 sugar binding n=1 Tax=Pedobacter heparinus (strain ATCC 13125 / DSM 2366 / CIP 104194 / JCM 7457 / NBRC 12017 / NCIMB 9290 / NRRL B-14731 / HIM 762-3) TaxID=485917 RepID=C6XVF9_PEDHD|nr:glycoside hydrolase family 2 [Pedobacter heparinus]ACU04025.1 glycoside hydrolase family 2 sugar binding [Pedobacter heparinus DSM 2366]
MKTTVCSIFAVVLFTFFNLSVKGQYKMQPVSIQTRWAVQVSPVNALKEYPRPQMVRSGWTNLNGLWDYAITAKDAAQPAVFDGKILVPYPLESALSGVKKALLPSQNLWYKRSFARPDIKSGEKVMLNFGAVDYQCWVYVNGTLLGEHEGGYTEFSFDITAALKAGNNEIVVKVFDPTGEGIGPHGKQVLKPENIYYTPSSGIWQTVWMEVVPEVSIAALVMTPDVDKGVLNLEVKGKGKPEIVVYDPVSKQEISRRFASLEMTNDGAKGTIKIPNAKLWSPGNPHLYDITVKLGDDEVKSYFGMRKISVDKDAAGVDRIFLNNRPYFNLGTLDQGFWPDGLYTAPTDEALAFDIRAIKAMGFNTIRKHIKVEPARWYYHADKIGMLVWQDMVNPNQGLPEGAKAAFEKGAKETMAQLHNYPSITTWVLFNEAWGQYDQERLTKWMKGNDPSRIVNGHSGELLYVNEKLRAARENPYVAADMTDVHAYPDPMNALKQPGKAQVLGEFGGIGVFIPDHQWLSGSAWGYIQEKPAALAAKYKIMNQHLQLLEKEGLSASIYTQPFDVEGEQNGLMTYDREVVKVPFAELREIHKGLNPEVAAPSWLAMTKLVSAKDADLTEPALVYAKAIEEYLKGKKDPAFLKKLVMMAGQTGDKAGTARFGAAYMNTLKEPYSAEDIAFMESITKKVTDKGFAILLKQAGTDRTAYVKAMNVIYADVIAGFVPKADSKPDWNAVEAAIKPYGLPGEEMFLRARTIHLYNQKDWAAYVPVASAYLEKFGSGISESDRQAFQAAIDQNRGKE